MDSWNTTSPRAHAELIARALEEARRNLDRSASPSPARGYHTPPEDDSDNEQAAQIEALLQNSDPASPVTARNFVELHRSQTLAHRSSSSSSPSPTRQSRGLRRRADDYAPVSTTLTVDLLTASTPHSDSGSNPFRTRSPSPQSRAGLEPRKSSEEGTDREQMAAILSSLGPNFPLTTETFHPADLGKQDLPSNILSGSASQVNRAAISTDGPLMLRPSSDSDEPPVQSTPNPEVSTPAATTFLAPRTGVANDALRSRSISPVSRTSSNGSRSKSRQLLISSGSERKVSPVSDARVHLTAPRKIPTRRGSKTVTFPVLSPSSSHNSTYSNSNGEVSLPGSSRSNATLTPLRNPFRNPPTRPIYISRKSSFSEGTPLSYRDLGSDFTRYPTSADGNRRKSSLFENSPLSAQSRTASRQSMASLADSLASTTVGSEKGLVVRSYAVDPEKGFTPFLDDRLGAPPAEKQGYSFKMYHDEPEDDDDMHMPAFDDDIRFKPKFKDHFTRDTLSSSFALFLVVIGLLGIFVGLPVASETGFLYWGNPYESPLTPYDGDGPAWAHVNNRTYPLLKNVRQTLIDPDTPLSAYNTTSTKGEMMHLVFSDEFNTPGRSFYPGDDPFWYSPDFWYGSTGDIDWYSPENVNTENGSLALTLERYDSHNLQYLSGMIHSWNQTCFKGGKFEVGVSLPGPAGISGLWPGVWSMGNLGRPGYRATTDGVWPYTYDSCDLGITPNQSMYDGTSRLPGQRLSSCTCPGADHPTPGRGRGAPEIDIFEGAANPNNNMPTVTQSYQVAPFDIWYYPNYDFFEFPNRQKNFTVVNGYTGGPFQQALSATSTLNKEWYDGQEFQSFAYEYEPTSVSGDPSQSYIAWFVGEDVTLRMTGDAIGPNGNVDRRLISEEPMSLILNLGFSNNWGWLDWANLVFPTTMRVDYVRWYQVEGRESITCDPVGWETTPYIRDHPLAYTNPNLTLWDDAGYAWPENSLTSDCSRPNHPAAPMSPAAIGQLVGSQQGPGG